MLGFRNSHSTAQVIADLTDTLRKANHNSLYTCGIYVDYMLISIFSRVWVIIA